MQAALSSFPWVPARRRTMPTTPPTHYSANDCVASSTTCGTKIISDANDFYNTCHNVYGLSASQVATNIRYWADRARANGTNCGTLLVLPTRVVGRASCAQCPSVTNCFLGRLRWVDEARAAVSLFAVNRLRR